MSVGVVPVSFRDVRESLSEEETFEQKAEAIGPRDFCRGGGIPGRVTASVKVSVYLMCSWNCQEARGAGRGMTSEKACRPRSLAGLCKDFALL